MLLLVTVSCTPLPETSATSLLPAFPSPAPDWWRPSHDLTWQLQLDEDVDVSCRADVYDVDLFTDQSLINELHDRGTKVICYISAGSWEDWRPDADQYPDEILGRSYQGWPGERWVDIRRIDLLAPILRKRMDLCKAKGFDAVDPDNVEIYTNRTGFPLTYQDQLTFALWLAAEAHSRGLAIGLKNSPEMAADVIDSFDFSVTEDAFYYEWINDMLPFIESGKPVFAVEYTDMNVDFDTACNQARQKQISLIFKNRSLDAWRDTCP